MRPWFFRKPASASHPPRRLKANRTRRQREALAHRLRLPNVGDAGSTPIPGTYLYSKGSNRKICTEKRASRRLAESRSVNLCGADDQYQIRLTASLATVLWLLRLRPFSGCSLGSRRLKRFGFRIRHLWICSQALTLHAQAVFHSRSFHTALLVSVAASTAPASR